MGSHCCGPLGLGKRSGVTLDTLEEAALDGLLSIEGSLLLDHRPNLVVGMVGLQREHLVEHLLGCTLVLHIAT